MSRPGTRCCLHSGVRCADRHKSGCGRFIMSTGLASFPSVQFIQERYGLFVQLLKLLDAHVAVVVVFDLQRPTVHGRLPALETDSNTVSPIGQSLVLRISDCHFRKRESVAILCAHRKGKRRLCSSHGRACSCLELWRRAQLKEGDRRSTARAPAYRLARTDRGYKLGLPSVLTIDWIHQSMHRWRE